MSEETSNGDDRIQRILARAGVASRRAAKEMILEGRVTVNGQLAEVGGRANPERDAIKVDGKRLVIPSGPRRYLLLNKPKHVLSTVTDPEGRTTVIDLVPPGMRKALVPVGRLDYNTEGLILLTDDGDFAQHVAHPRYGGIKTYEVKVKGRPAESALDRLRGGIVLDGRRTRPARISARPAPGGASTKAQAKARGKRRAGEGDGENTWWVVELTEGRSRQIREMFFRIGHPVAKLRRVAIGPLRDDRLPVGALRELTEREVEMMRRVTAKPKKPFEPPPAKKTRADASAKADGSGDAPAPRPPRAAAPRPGSSRPGSTRPVASRPSSSRPGSDRPGARRPSSPRAEDRPAAKAHGKGRPRPERPRDGAGGASGPRGRRPTSPASRRPRDPRR